MKITEFNKQNFNDVRNIIQEKLDEIQKEHGIVITLGNMSFSKNSFRSKIDGLLINSNVTVIEETSQNVESNSATQDDSKIKIAKAVWDAKCKMLYLKPEDFRPTFFLTGANVAGKPFHFVRFDFAKYKYPIIVADENNRTYKISIEQYEKIIGHKAGL